MPRMEAFKRAAKTYLQGIKLCFLKAEISKQNPYISLFCPGFTTFAFNTCNDLFCSTVNNGTIWFEGSWSSVPNVTVFFSKCCQCCGLSGVPVCM